MSKKQESPQPPNPETADAATTAAYVAHRLTRGADALYLAKRRAQQSDLETAAGINDMRQGADMLAASEDIEAITTAVHLLHDEDLDDAMEIGSISGELSVIADVLAAMELDTLADFLLDHGQRLRELAVDNILRYGSLRALTMEIDETGEKLAELGEEEVAEGAARLDLADAAAANSEAMTVVGEEMIAKGLAALAAAQGARDAGAELES